MKEGMEVDEKKNVGFIPGLALILAALALVLISINAVKPTPSVEELEKAIDLKIASTNEALVAVVKNGDIVEKKVTQALFTRDVENLEATMAALAANGSDDLKVELDKLAADLVALKAKMDTKPVAADAKTAAK
jgi:hypothetical protein